MKNNKKFAFGILGILFALNILAWLGVCDLSQSRFLEVTFFDVGQGDSIFIETPQGHQILIDGGPSSIILEKLGKEMPFWDRTIDLIILTHPDHDHLAGLLEVLKRYKIENILWTGVVKDTSEFEEWQDLIEKEKAEIIIARAGQKIPCSGCSGSHPEQCSGWLPEQDRVEVLYPFESLEGEEVENTNNSSIVAKLVFGRTSFLFIGDIYSSIEKELIEREGNIKSDVLKVGHHGSKTSTALEFIAKVLPDIAVISVGGDNSYGHPHAETLETLEKYGIDILRTDEQGDIKLFSNGEKLKLKTQNSKIKTTTQN
ncbi:MAG: ComEC/Rec2 family competence protein [bacterium]